MAFLGSWPGSSENAAESYKSVLKQQARPILQFTVHISEDGRTLTIDGEVPKFAFNQDNNLKLGSTVVVNTPRLFILYAQQGEADPSVLKRIDQMCEKCMNYPDEHGVLKHGKPCSNTGLLLDEFEQAVKQPQLPDNHV